MQNQTIRTHTLHAPNNKISIVIAICGDAFPSSMGGCRVLPSEYNIQQMQEAAIKLAQAMFDKNSLYDLPLNGGKAVINFAPNMREEAFKTLGLFIDSLNGKYVTGLDLGTTQSDMQIVGSCTEYVAEDCVDATAQGIVDSIKVIGKNKYRNSTLTNLNVAVQGLGKVGLKVAQQLSKAGANITACDVNIKNINSFLAEAHGTIVEPEQIYDIPTDIFCPCAIGNVLNTNTVPRIQASTILGAANNQLESPDIAKLLTQRGIQYIPAELVNSGGVLFAGYRYLGLSISETQVKLKSIPELLDRYLKLAKSSDSNPLECLAKLRVSFAKKHAYESA